MSNDLIKTFYSGKNAKNYNANRTAKSRTPSTAKWFFEDDVLANYLASMDKKLSIVDAPVGTGRFFHLYEQFPNIIGMDYSQDMLNEAAKESNTFKNINIDLQQINLIEEEVNEYDILVCFRLINLLPIDDALKVLENLLVNNTTGGMISIRDVEPSYDGEAILKNKIHMHDKEKLQTCIDELGFDITKEHVFADNGKPGRYCVYEIAKK